jgi:hypothetical protein
LSTDFHRPVFQIFFHRLPSVDMEKIVENFGETVDI